MPRSLLFIFINLLLTTACEKQTQRADISHRISSIRETALENHIDAITASGPRASKDIRSTRQVAEYIKSQLLLSGYEPVEESVGVSAPDGDGSYQFVNLIAERPGNGKPARILEIGAHYDTVEKTPGADDNASGIAAVLEIAGALATMDAEHTIRFCFYALEESGRDGSIAHVQNIQRRDEALDGAIIFEMIGYATDQPDTQRSPARIPLLFSPPSTGNFVAVVGNFRSGGLGNLFETAARRYVPGLPYFSANRLGGFFKDALRSDHKPYWDKGYRAIMLTDTANFRNPNYHLPSDTRDTLNYSFLKHVAQATAATAIEWSQPHPSPKITP